MANISVFLLKLLKTLNNEVKLKTSDTAELERCVKKRLGQATSAYANCSLGEKLFIKKQLELSPFKPIEFTGWSDWENDPLNNRSWQWRLNWLSFLSYLLAYHKASGNDEVLSFSRDAIQSWLDTYLLTNTNHSFEFIWHDHATALRAEQLVLFVYYCREYAPAWAELHTEFLKYIERALLVHGKWLAKDSFYSAYTNHGLEQARVLLLLGTVFHGKQARKWQQIAVRRISSELKFAFTNEGIHVENSPAYHIFVFKVFLGIIKDYPKNILGDLSKQFDQLSSKALSFITHILRPDGMLPPIGDTEQLPTTDSYRESFGDTVEYQHFLYALSQGQQGKKPENLNVVYTKSGYAILRDRWPERSDYKQALHAIVKVGCSSRYHHQQDEGHVSLYAANEDWLIDSGLYNYANKDPVRKYMRSRAGHNVPIVSNAGYASKFEHRLRAWEIINYSENEDLPFVRMKLDVIKPISHIREVAFDRIGNIFFVKDEVKSNDGEKRNITLQWHLPNDKVISIDGNNNVLVESRSGNSMSVEFQGDMPDFVKVAKGRQGNKIYSFFSRKANELEESQVVRLHYKEKVSLFVEAKFSFNINSKSS